MTVLNIAHQRLASQHVVQPAFARPGEVVAWLGAVQAQDYLGALWAVGLRTQCATEQTVEQAIADKTIVRTWPMRGTIHFVAPADVRWMLELLTPRVIARSASRLAGLGLDDATISRSADVLAKALQGGKQIPRTEMYDLLEQANIATDGQRGLHILGRLAHERLLCFGARAGKQPTFALLDEWAPSAKSLPRDEALATLAKRYFTGHGPATLQDFMWWSGLTARDARAGIEAAAPQLGHEVIGDQEYYFAPDVPNAHQNACNAFLLPPFDEYLVGYKDRAAAIDATEMARVNPGGNGMFSPIMVIGGRVAGTWKRTFKRDTVEIAFSPFMPLNDAQRHAFAEVAQRYGEFVGKTAIVAG
jgi:hypothetical protein